LGRQALHAPAFSPHNTRKPGAKEIPKNSKLFKRERLKKNPETQSSSGASATSKTHFGRRGNANFTGPAKPIRTSYLH
jgi:hypothetical protein